MTSLSPNIDTFFCLYQEQDEDHLDHVDISPVKIPVKTLSQVQDESSEYKSYEGEFNITGKFLGFTKIKLVLTNGSDDDEYLVSQAINVQVSYIQFFFNVSVKLGLQVMKGMVSIILIGLTRVEL